MTYNLENLGPERFQQLCQALLTRELPNVQCFPVAQPDGGRDAILYTLSSSTGMTFVVFQMKFVRKPFAETDPHRWLVEIMQDEAPKLRELIPKGATAYYLITNVPGTAHLDNGSIDKINRLLGLHSDIPAFCWWRDDIERRLDNAWDLKWMYPDILTGPDILRYIMEQGLAVDKDRRTQAIKAFVQSQYDQDLDVRFKQVDLQNRLLDLFIDVPIAATQHKEGRLGNDHPAVGLLRRYSGEDPRLQGAAAMILDPEVQALVPLMVIEGAPGQGKSTLAQFICQVHRLRILNKKYELERLPEHHRPTAVRIPFKVDLRHLATWISKRDPFSAEDSDAVPEHWSGSLEAFLAAQIRYLSGGVEFSVADLLAVVSISSCLLVLDGLDEVADIEKRKKLVEVVMAGVNRLQQNAASLQVVITSRPAAFANSPGFPASSFPHFYLASLTTKHVESYATRWLTAKRIVGDEAQNVKVILQQKLALPHLQDLSRNTMQLVILLSLIHTRGASLPDKRTAVYDSYVSLFFDRECEKSPLVRDNRELLIDLHRYLAWFLHSEAETGSGRGSIGTERLKTVLFEYLRGEGRDTLLAESLFTGVVERVVFLVSRVEGTFEFEVQPVREYFAARYLYETAPYSPPGAERRGTKPDRFDAIAQNLYWLNVTRFFAGCFSKGELPALVDRLSDLAADQRFEKNGYAYRLTAMLVTDWVFAQYLKSLREAMELVLRGLSRYVSMFEPPNQGERPIFPEGTARDLLMEECWIILHDDLHPEFAAELISLMLANGTPASLLQRWLSACRAGTGRFSTWLQFGAKLGCLALLSRAEMEAVFPEDEWTIANLRTLLSAGRDDVIVSSERRTLMLVEDLLDGNGTQTFPFGEGLMSVFALALNSGIYSMVNVRYPEGSVLDLLTNAFGLPTDLPDDINVDIPTLLLCAESVSVYLEEMKRDPSDWAHLDPWNRLVEHLRSNWGDRFAIYTIAFHCRRVQTSIDAIIDCSELLNHSMPLCRRVLYAEAQVQSEDWWSAQLKSVSSSNDAIFVVLACGLVASVDTLIKLRPTLEPVIAAIPEGGWNKLISAISSGNARTSDSVGRKLRPTLSLCSTRLLHLLSLKVGDKSALEIYERHLLARDCADGATAEYWYRTAIACLCKGHPKWLVLLAGIRALYPTMPPFELRWNRRPDTIPGHIAERIASDPREYPRVLVRLANSQLTQDVARATLPIRQVADTEKWFD